MMPSALPGPASAAPPAPPAPPPTKPQKPAKEPKPAKTVKTREKSGSSAFVPALVGGLLVAAVLGYIISSGGGGGGEGKAFSNANLSVKAPADFAPMGTPPAVEGLNVAEPIAIAAGGKAEGPGVIAGMVPAEADNSTLLPAPLVKALNLPPDQLVAKRTAVKLNGDIQAYKYENLQVKGLPGDVTVFASPTSTGVATVACFGAVDCDGVATTLTIKGGDPLPVGPNEAYAKSVGEALSGLSKAIADNKSKLGAAATSAAAAGKIRDAYGDAAKALGEAPAGPADRSANTALTAALQAGEKAYGQLSSAAKKKDRAAYSKASKAVTKAEGDVSAALEQLKAAGYATE
jgi:hypothetical protein